MTQPQIKLNLRTMLVLQPKVKYCIHGNALVSLNLPAQAGQRRNGSVSYL